MSDTNLIMPSSMVRHAIQPAGCEPADVTTVLVTRYWVDPSEGMPKNRRPTLEYLEGRAELFERWCVASVVAQTRVPHAWVVLVSPWVFGMLPPRVLKLVDDLPFAVWSIVPEGKAFSSIVRECIGLLGLPINPFTVVARLDNDDAIAVDFVHALGCWVVRAKPGTPATLVFPHGVQVDAGVDPRRDPAVARTDMYTTNHFTATVTSFRQADGGARVALPFEHAHTEIYRDQGKHPSTRRGVHQLITRYPMWAEVLHDSNAANHERPGPLAWMSDDDWRTRFGVVG